MVSLTVMHMCNFLSHDIHHIIYFLSGDLLQPNMKKKKTVVNPKPKHLTSRQVDKYCLKHQEQDSEGEVRTELYKVSLPPSLPLPSFLTPSPSHSLPPLPPSFLYLSLIVTPFFSTLRDPSCSREEEGQQSSSLILRS